MQRTSVYGSALMTWQSSGARRLQVLPSSVVILTMLKSGFVSEGISRPVNINLHPIASLTSRRTPSSKVTKYMKKCLWLLMPMQL